MKIYPFCALRPKDEKEAQAVSELPYDVFSHQEVKEKLEQNGKSVLSVTRPDGFFKETRETNYQEQYQKAAEKLQQLSHTSLTTEKVPCFYIYQIEWQENKQTGIVCLSDIKEYEENRIKKHENTRQEKVQDRLHHMETINAQTGNVLLIYRENARLLELLKTQQQAENPIFICQKERGVVHKIWRISSNTINEQIQRIFETEVECTYIADGHHRVAAAHCLYKKKPTKNKFLTTLFADTEVSILPYNRLVQNVYNYSKDEILQLISKEFKIQNWSGLSRQNILMFIGDAWFELVEKNTQKSSRNTEKILPASILQEKILNPIFGVKDPKKDEHIQFVGGVLGCKALVDRVLDKSFFAAFALRKVTTQELLNIADSQEMMPPKSTWFEPKLLDGLFIYLL